MDDLDDLERICQQQLVTAECDGLEPMDIDRIQADASCRTVLSLIERCRKAEHDCDALEDQIDVLRAGIEARVEGWRREIEEHKARAEKAEAAIDRVGCFVDLEIAKIPTVLKGGNEALIYDHIKALLEKEKPCQDQ